MIRKSLFIGLTLVLIAALLALIVQGRKLEKEQPLRQVEVVQQSKPSATRVLGPQDIEIVRSKMQWEDDSAQTKAPRTALHEVEIRNNGSAAYAGIQLRFTYLSGGGKTVETRVHNIVMDIPPGAVLRLDDIKFNNLPPSAKDFRVVIDYADLGTADLQEK